MTRAYGGWCERESFFLGYGDVVFVLFAAKSLHTSNAYTPKRYIVLNLRTGQTANVRGFIMTNYATEIACVR